MTSANELLYCERGKNDKFTRTELRYIEENIGKLSTLDMAKHLKCSMRSVQRRIRQIKTGVNYDRDYRKRKSAPPAPVDPAIAALKMGNQLRIKK